MIKKFCLFGLLAAVISVSGCGEKMKMDMETMMEKKMVKLQTSKGDIIIELNPQAAPISVDNFLRYVEEGFYDGTIFHRVIYNFMIQGGGFTKDMQQKETHKPIKNEANNGLSNYRGTIAMARANDPDSATAQFFINHIDNYKLDYNSEQYPGYAVFGKMIEGFDVLDEIAKVETTTRQGYNDVPVEPVIINSATVISQ